MRYLIIADIHANIDALTAVLDAEPAPGTICSSSATSSATARRRTRSSIASASSTPIAIIRGNHDKAACGIEDGSNFNQVARARRALDARDAHRRRTGSTSRSCPPGRRPSTSTSRSATARPSTKTTTSSTARMRCTRSARAAARCACSRTRTCRSCSTTRMRRSTGSFRSRTRRPSIDAAAGRAVSGQRRLGRPAARRRSACGLWRLRFRARSR